MKYNIKYSVFQDYIKKCWEGLKEEQILDIIEETYLYNGYKVTNLHKTDRRHEDGIDILVEKKEKNLGIQFKIKPKKGDIEQLKKLLQHSDKERLYIYINSPTKPFKKELDKNIDKLNVWDASQFSDFLILNDSSSYLCLLLSSHPLIQIFNKVYSILISNRKKIMTNSSLSTGEIHSLWNLKDNAVKIKIPLMFIYAKWNNILRTKTEYNKDEYKQILNEVFLELDIAYRISRDKLLSSFYELEEIYPHILGKLWELCSKRTGWGEYTHTIEKLDSKDKQEMYINSCGFAHLMI